MAGYTTVPAEATVAMVVAIIHETSRRCGRVISQKKEGNLDIVPSNLEHQQLVSNIQHLQRQLTLAMAMGQAQQATIQAHEAAIEAQRVTIVTQQQILSGEVFVRSVQSVTPAAEDKEELLGGLVHVGQAELVGGVSFNLAEVIRRWWRRWGKGE